MKISDMTNEELCALTVAVLDDRGYEIVNPKPTKVRIPGAKPDLETRIKQILSLEIRRREMKNYLNTPGNENPTDFEVEDDPEPSSMYEVMEDEGIEFTDETDPPSTNTQVGEEGDLVAPDEPPPDEGGA